MPFYTTKTKGKVDFIIVITPRCCQGKIQIRDSAKYDSHMSNPLRF